MMVARKNIPIDIDLHLFQYRYLMQLEDRLMLSQFNITL